MIEWINSLFGKTELKTNSISQFNTDDMKDGLPLVNEKMLIAPNKYKVIYVSGICEFKIGKEFSTHDRTVKGYQSTFDDQRKILKLSKGGIVVKCKEI